MSLDNNNTKRIYTEIESEKSPVLILSHNLMSCVNQLHGACGSTEWSGILFFKVLEGSIEEPDKLIMKADYIYPMDVGTAGWTEFNYTAEYLDAYDLLPIMEDDVIVYKSALVHSHHSMKTFFSGTDLGTLHEQSPNYNYFLSLIVNFACDYQAKIAMFGKSEETSVVFKGTDKEFSVTAPGSDVLVVYDCKVLLETETWFDKRIEDLKEAKRNKIYRAPEFKSDSTSQIKIWDWEDSYPVKLSVSEEQLKLIISQTLLGDLISADTIYNALKTVASDFRKMKDKEQFAEELEETIQGTFEDACCNLLSRQELSWDELENLAERCVNLLKTYNFGKEFREVLMMIYNSFSYFEQNESNKV